MTDEQMRIAIAEACGWTEIQWSELINPCIAIEKKQFCRDTEPFRCLWLPDYLNDLNAMHEAEKVLTEAGVNIWWKYVGFINRHNETFFGLETAVHATARQRAEAFLRTKGIIQ